MIDDLYLTELFDQYMEDELTPAEKEGFESLLASNPVIAEKFRLFTDINKALMQEDIMDLRQQLKNIQAQNTDILEAGPMQIAPMKMTNLHEEKERNFKDVLEQCHEVLASGLDQRPDAELELIEDVKTESSFEKGVNKAILQDDIMALRVRLHQISKLYLAPQRSTPSLRKYLIYASSAAAVVIMLIAGTLTLNQRSSSGTDQAYAGLFQTYEAVSVPRGPVETSEKIRNTAIELFNDGDFVQAGNLLDAIISNGETSRLIHVYAGACALQNGDPDKGIHYLADWNPTEPTYIDAQWFLAGCYLSKNEPEKALSILEELIKNESFKKYSYPAEKLVKKLLRQH